MPPNNDRILVIKLGALGDFVLALGPAAAIRRHHADAHITLLTTAPFADLAKASGLFDEVSIDARPRPWQPAAWLALSRFLNAGRFGRVYDLQTSDRSGWYYRLFSPKPEWSGIARGCSHPHANPGRDLMHTVDRQTEQLRMAGIADVPLPDLSFLQAEIGRFGLVVPYVLLIPGGAAHRPAKRWPERCYTALAQMLAERNWQPVVLGGPEEAALAAAIAADVPGCVDLAGRTSFADIAVLARNARAAVGNDTGPMHLVAAAGAPSVVLFSAESDPALCAPRGRAVTVLRRDDLSALDVDDVAAALPD